MGMSIGIRLEKRRCGENKIEVPYANRVFYIPCRFLGSFLAVDYCQLGRAIKYTLPRLSISSASVLKTSERSSP
jgi:hypothetical protein